MSGVFGDVIGGVSDNYNTAWTTVRVEDKGGATPDCPANLCLPCD